jgi:hypothetical protein
MGKAEQIRARRNGALRAAGAVGANKSQIASIAARRAAIERQALVDLGKLRPPAHVASDWHVVVTYTRLTLLHQARLGEYASSHSASSVSRFERVVKQGTASPTGRRGARGLEAVRIRSMRPQLRPR